MDEEQLKESLAKLLPTMLPGLLEPFTTGLTEQFLGDVRAYLEKPATQEEKQSPVTDEADPEKQALIERLAALEARDKERETAAKRSDFENILSQNLDRYNPTFREQVLKELGAQFDKAKQGPNGWQLEGGKTVAEAVDQFFSTDYGKHLLPSTHADGVGTPDPKPVPTTTPEPSTAEMLKQAFLG